jgi:Flp pilus assembly protein CpaB
MRKTRIAAVAAAAALVPVSGAAYAALNTVPTTANDAVAETSSSVLLSQSGGTPVTVTSLSLPAGSWVLSSQLSLVSWSPSDYARCQIVAGSNQIASGTTMIGDPDAPGAHGASTFVAGRGLIGAVRSTTPFVASLRCSHDSAMTAPPYVDPGATLLAHKSGSLYGSTH